MQNGEKISFSFRIEQTKSGYPTLAVKPADDAKDIFLHSRFNPLSESERFSGKYDPSKYDFIIVLGAALGYHLLPLKDLAAEYKKVIIIDYVKESKDILKQNPLAGFIFNSENIHLLAGLSPGEIAEFLKQQISFDSIKGISVVDHPQSVRLCPEFYKDVNSEISSIIDSKGSNAATIRRFAMRYVSNIIRNLHSTKKFHPVSSLFGKFKTYRAFVVTPGPSLPDYLGLIHSLKDSVFIISVDSAIATLAHAGITPDIVVSIDPQPYVEEHLAAFIPSDIISVFSISSYYKCPAEYGGYISMNTHPVSQVVEGFSSSPVGSVDSLTGSVAGDALSLAVKCGFEEIYLFGFDFSFSDFNIYARGTSYQTRFSACMNSRFSPPETRNLNYIMQASGALKSEGRFTRKSFLNYKQNMERFLEKNRISGVFNFDSNSLKLNGTVSAGPDEINKIKELHSLDKPEIKKNAVSRSVSLNRLIDLKNMKDFLNNKKIKQELARESGCSHKINKFNKTLSLL